MWWSLFGEEQTELLVLETYNLTNIPSNLFYWEIIHTLKENGLSSPIVVMLSTTVHGVYTVIESSLQ